MSNFFDNDLPVSSKSEDLLGRRSLAQKIAELVNSATPINNVLIGLRGSWGGGKTSFLGMVKSEIDTSKSVVVYVDAVRMATDTNPYMHLVNEIALALFRAIENDDSAHDLNVVFKMLTSSLVLTENHRDIIKGIKEWGYSAVKKMLGVKDEGSKAISEALEKESQKKQSRLITRSVINTATQLNKKVLVIIDEIDRVPEKYIERLFYMSRQILSIDGFSMIMAYDKSALIQRLRRCTDMTDLEVSRFLEKYVQIEMSLPPLSYEDRIEFLANRIYARSADDNGKKQVSVLAREFANIRQMKRFCNTFRMNQLLTEGLVKPGPLSYLTYIQVFFPELLDRIGRLAEVLTLHRSTDFLARLKSLAIISNKAHRRNFDAKEALRGMFNTASNDLLLEFCELVVSKSDSSRALTTVVYRLFPVTVKMCFLFDRRMEPAVVEKIRGSMFPLLGNGSAGTAAREEFVEQLRKRTLPFDSLSLFLNGSNIAG